MRNGRLVILLVEDEENDILFVRHATEKSNANHTLNAVHDGKEAIRYLRGEGLYADRQKFPSPNVVLTDLKMPGMNGFDLLKWLRSHPECSVIPVIVYSTSRLEADVREAYRLGANSFIYKPTDLNELVDIFETIYDYWSKCECPPTPNNC
jgi:CheY-like chemotaxis protein